VVLPDSEACRCRDYHMHDLKNVPILVTDAGQNGVGKDSNQLTTVIDACVIRG
jgi:hypothetical protein